MKQSLAVDLNGLVFPHPVLAASGCLGTGRDVPPLVDLPRLAGVVSRSLTWAPSKGWAAPRTAETPSGLLWAVGMHNPGAEAFVEHDLPRFVKAGVPVIASVAGSDLDEYVRVASYLHLQPGVVALEVYLSCPDEDGEPMYARRERIVEIVGQVSRLSRLPVFAKLPPLLPDVVEAANACVRAGAFGLTLIDAVPGLALDADRLRTKTATPVGALAGPAIKPIGLAVVHRVTQAMPSVPVMGVGGIVSGEDAVEYLLAGAWAVQVGTALLIDPSAHVQIARGILQYLRAKGLRAPGELRGRLRVGGAPGRGG